MLDAKPPAFRRYAKRMRPVIDAAHRASYRALYRLARCWWFVRRPTHHGVFAAVWHDDAVLLIRNAYRHWILLPGGHVDRGETYAQAAARELAEEAGVHLAPEALEEAGIFLHRTEHLRDFVHVFEITLPARPAVTIDNREVVWAAFVKAADAERLPLLPPLRDYLALRM